MTVTIHHPELEATIEAVDEAQAEVFAQSGWLPGPLPDKTKKQAKVKEPTDG